MKDVRTPISTWLLAVAGNASLLLFDGAAVPFLLASISLLTVFMVVERRTGVRLPKNLARAADLLVATCIVGIATTHFAFGKENLPTLGYVLSVGQLARAFRRKSGRDLAAMNGIALAQLCLAAFLSRADAYLPLFVVAVLLGVASSLRLPGLSRRQGEDTRLFIARPRGRAGMRARVGAVTQPFLLGACLLFIGFAFFLLLPRGAPFRTEEEVGARQEVLDPNDYSEDQEEAARRITGFSEDVKLGEVGRVKLVPWKAFLVELEVRARPTRLPAWLLYFRGTAMDTFDGSQWERSAALRSRERWLKTRGGGGTLPLRKGVPDVEVGFRKVRQRYYMYATTSRVLFALDAPISLDLTSELPHIRRIGPHSFAAPLPHSEGFAYSVTSCVPTDPERRILVENLSPGAAAPYLTIPPESEAIIALAKEIAGRGEPLEKARRLMDWLAAECEYTLLFTEEPAGSALDHFLFKTRAGHCEYFATALAMLLRAVDVPTRLVVGYRGGQWFEDDELYLVRQSDAHAWVEAHMPGRGWIRLDPTPADRDAVIVPPSRVPGVLPPPEEAAFTDQAVDFVKDFGPQERQLILAGVGTAIDFVTCEGFGIGRRERPFPPPGIVLVVLFTAGIVGRALWRRMPAGVRLGPRRRDHGAKTEAIAARFYEEAVAQLARRGLTRRRSQSPREFMVRAAPSLAEAAPVFREITVAFEGVRYGQAPVSESESERLMSLARSLTGGLEEGFERGSGETPDAHR
jgi:transglutaminase-like putative cysteine protease